MRTLIAFILSVVSVHAGLIVDSCSRNGAIKTVVTDASVTPSTNQTVVSAGWNGIRVWTGSTPVSEPYFYLYVSKNGGASTKLRVFRWMGRILTATSGDSFSFGTSDGRTIYVTPMYAPATTETPAGVTGTANCDKAGPPLWDPTAAHINLPTNVRSFTINYDGTERNVFLSEFDGYQWTPMRWLKLEAARSATVRTSYRKIALANYDGATVSITAASGAIIGGNSAWMTLPIAAITGTTRQCTDVSQFWTACSTAVAGDEIVLMNSGSPYAVNFTITDTLFAANIAAGNKGSEGILIRGETTNRASVVLTCAADNQGALTIDNTTATRYCAIKDITLAFTNSNSSVKLINGKWQIQNLHIFGPNGTATDLVTVQNTGGNTVNSDFLFVDADHSSHDIFNGSGSINSNCRLIACSGITAGASSADQCVTTHSGMPFYLYGGTYSDANSNVIANDSDASPCYLFFVTTSNGVRSSGVVNFDAFGCAFGASSTVQGNLSPLSPGYIVQSKSQQLIRISSGKTWTIDHNYLQSFATGRGIFPSVGGNSFNFNVLANWSEAIRVQNSAAGGTVTMINNTMTTNSTAFSFGDANLTQVIKNNALRINANGIALTAGENTRATKLYNVIDPVVSANYTAGTGDTTGVDAALDSNFIPTAGGNCDGNGDTSAVDWVGGSDPWGLVLIYKPDRISRGAREIPSVYSGATLYPDIW